MPESFEILEHTADIGFRAWGSTPAELFENAARAMMDIAAETESVKASQQRDVETGGEDYESLLVNWLSELLYLFDSGEFVAGAYGVQTIEPTRLKARLEGEPREPARHPWKLIVKAVTYHQLEVRQKTAAGKHEFSWTYSSPAGEHLPLSGPKVVGRQELPPKSMRPSVPLRRRPN